MIKKIKSVSNMGVFDGYRWPSGSSLNEFKRFNILYGANGSGKTTLSRLFRHLATGDCEPFPDLKYSLEAESGTLKETDAKTVPIRVFNADYVRSNIGEIEGELNPIFIIGKDQKDLQAELAENEKEYVERQSKLNDLTGQIDSKEKARGKEFTDIAKVIGVATQGLTSRTYRKPQAELAYKSLTEFKVLSNDELETLKLIAEQKKLDSISKLDLGTFEIDLSSLAETSNKLLIETVEAIVIPRLRENPRISLWVESGIELHESGSQCEFCGSVVTEDRLKALAAHFNDADKSLKEDLQKLIENYDAILQSLQSFAMPSKLEFFDEFQLEYATYYAAVKEKLSKLRTYVVKAKKLVERKLVSRTEVIEFNIILDSYPVAEALRQTNEVIGAHNTKSKSFEEARTLASSQIEQHYLSTIQSDVEAYDNELDQLKADVKAIQDGNEETKQLSLDELDAEIKRKRGLIANTQQAAEDLTKKLEIFLGRKELRFDPEGDGYRIYRKSVPAQGLSEGEKTAIAFVYFSVQLEDQDFDKTTGIVVVDDPISSLDASSTYQAFAFLKEAVKDSKQVFLLTHNFDFLKLLLNWIKHHPYAKKNREYFMLKAKATTGDARKSWIESMDKALTENGSEYVFLFKQVRDYTCDGTIENAYPMPNIIRKLLEQFLEFMCPTAEKNHQKLQSIQFDPIKKTALNKYANDFSHPTGKGLDPSLVDETRNNAQHLIEMIQTVAPTHYKNLNRN
ncbi:AAA family ATPase [Ruficoccus sp. ZRK36]|uniref:AAA family ATPase n=1 Tax=Ruficoccus sp. ZRK36 TaxID=2866311 RepID=UPI001C733175|nr:AAA family ATPase [Ruficoccus sp. ZRK36]QYY34808.1 AAA family ATPase [Ruficoccus sp. ZRK36]